MNCSFFWSFHVGAFFSDPIFSKKTSFFLKFSFFTNESHADFFPLSVSMFLVLVLVLSAGREERTLHVLDFFSNASNIAVHLFVWYDLCFIWCTYEWENKNPCDRRLWIPHTFWCIPHIKWANVFLVGGVKNEFYGIFFPYALWLYVHVCGVFFFFWNYSVHKNRAFVQTNTQR